MLQNQLNIKTKVFPVDTDMIQGCGESTTTTGHCSSFTRFRNCN